MSEASPAQIKEAHDNSRPPGGNHDHRRPTPRSVESLTRLTQHRNV